MVVLGIGLLLATSCAAETKYDIDLECWESIGRSSISFINGSQYDEDGTQTIECRGPERFMIKCDDATVQQVDRTYLCSTHDKKSVRVRVVPFPEH